jgi:hypothetical protein
MHVILSDSEGSPHFILKRIPGCFTELTLSSFAPLRTVRSGRANGFSMTVFEIFAATEAQGAGEGDIRARI